MRKKILFIFAFILSTVVLVSCSKKITLSSEIEEVNLNVGDEYLIEVETNDKKGVTYEALDDSLVEVSKDGLIMGLKEGKTEVKVSSKTKSNVSINIKVNVINVETVDFELAEGMEVSVDVPNNATFDIGNKYISTIDETGLLVAESKGETQIKVYEGEMLVKLINVKVVGKVNEVTLSGDNELFLDETIQFKHEIRPLNGYDNFKYVLSDDEIAKVDENGLLTPLKAGDVTVKIVSLQSDDISDEIEVKVKETIVVDKTNDELKLGNHTFKKGVDLFDSLDEAIDLANENAKIILNKVEVKEELELSKNLILSGIDSSFNNKLILNANNIELNNLEFKDNAKIETNKIDEFVFKNNKVTNLDETFLEVEKYKKLNISSNVFEDINGDAIVILDMDAKSETLIEKNEINNVNEAIVLNSNTRLAINSYAHFYRNVIDEVETAFNINLNDENLNTNAILYARFNEVTNYNKAIINQDENKFEYTLNYWGVETLDLDKFSNVDEMYLLGHYENKENIVDESKYKPTDPIIVDLANPIDIIELGDTHKLEPVVLPYSSDKSNVMIAIDNQKIMKLSRTWELQPVRSGMVTLTVASYAAMSDAKKFDIEVTTDPGIHFELDNQTHDLNVGDEFNIKANPYPFNFEDEDVTFTSSNDDLATVDVNGKVVINGVGSFIITAKVDGEAIFEDSLEFTSYDDFEEDNVLDFITQKQLTYSNMHEITLYGTAMYDVVHNESVTRVLLDEYPVHREHEWFLDKIYPGFRPGTPFNSDLPDEFKFNDDNVVWIVVHDTGNSEAGTGANLHARYLYNQATGNGRQASWHYTVDATEAYMHLPENEIAYHAGDGSALPGLDKESPALGGGNRNGIGIEMSVQNDGHIFKTWQNTAKLVGELLLKYNLPLSHQRYHNDFSGKECPQSLRKAGLIDFFEELVENEYNMRKNYSSNVKSINFTSDNPEIMNNSGTIIKTPNHSTQVSYTVDVELNDGTTLSRTFNTLIEGFYR